MSHPAPESSLDLEGPCGYLENLFRPTPSGVAPRAAAVLCHPHPLFGGTMHNKTLYRLAKRLSADLDIASLRFNFRGTGNSLGRHDNGMAEIGDVRAAFDRITREFPGLPIIVVGYSFGAYVGLRAGIADPRVNSLIALGTPLQRDWDMSFLAETQKARLFVQGENDEFGNADAMRDFVARMAGAVTLEIVDGADHLFHGVEDTAVDRVVNYLQRSGVPA